MRLLALLAPVCAALDDRERAAHLASLLGPYRSGLVTLGISSGDPTAHYLGLLAETLGRGRRRRHFAESVRVAEVLGAPASLARTRLEWAKMLARSGQPDNAARAESLVADALATAASLGFARVAEQIHQLL